MKYETKIISVLRRNRAKTYTVEQIRAEVVGTRRSWLQKGYSPFYVDNEYKKVDEALDRLVRRGDVYKKEDGSGNTVYGIRTSKIKRACLRLGKFAVWRVVKCFSVSLDRHVKKIHGNWLTVCGMMMALASIVMVLLQ